MSLLSQHLNNIFKNSISLENKVWSALAELYDISFIDSDIYYEIVDDLFKSLESLPIQESEISFDDLEKQYAAVIRKKLLAARIEGVPNKNVPRDPTLTLKEIEEYKRIPSAAKTGIIIAPTRDEMTAIQLVKKIQKEANEGLEEIKDYQKLENERQELIKQLVKTKDPALKAELKETEEEIKKKLAEINRRIEEPFRIDKDKFIANITKEPENIFSQNEKMSRTSKLAKGQSIFVYETGIPAFKGLVYDEKTGKFDIVKTCPAAGKCLLVCYARKGYYSMTSKPLKLTRRLNLLINRPERYKEKAVEELIKLAKKHNAFVGTNNTLVIRWNDAGDFFSRGGVNYLNIAKQIIKEISNKEIDGKKIQIKSYAYTKDAANLEDDSDIIWNFSRQGKQSFAKGIDFKKHKSSEIVPADLFKDFFVKKSKGYAKDENNNIIWAKDKNKNDLIKRIYDHYANEYDLTLTNEPGKSQLIMQSDLPEKESPEKNKYAVIVLPTGDTDLGAQRRDVKTMFLLEH